MKTTDKIYIAGHRGLVGSALMRRLSLPSPAGGRGAGGEGPYTNLLTRTHAQLDLTNQQAVDAFFAQERPDYVFLAAAKVGGIHANNEYPAEFIRDNLAIQTNVTIGELQQLCPGVSRDMVRHVLREQQELGHVDCTGRGAGAAWSKGSGKGNRLPPNKGNEEGNQ